MTESFGFLSRVLLPAIILLSVSSVGHAHHSFAPYDIRSPIEVTGSAEEWTYRNPHPQLLLKDGDGVTWDIEVPIRRWVRAGIEPDAIEVGDQLTVKVFPARDGNPYAAMSGFTKEGTYYSVTEEVRQQSGNEAADAIEAGASVEEVLEKYVEPE